MLWTPQAMACFRSAHAGVRILWIGVNRQADYRAAIDDGADAVLVDSPQAAAQWRGR
jgi:glycerophosphoryl diester phosphodiesterase